MQQLSKKDFREKTINLFMKKDAETLMMNLRKNNKNLSTIFRKKGRLVGGIKTEPRVLKSALNGSAILYKLEYGQKQQDDTFRKIEDGIKDFEIIINMERQKGNAFKYYFTAKVSFSQSKNRSIITDLSPHFRSKVFRTLIERKCLMKSNKT